MPEMDPDRLAGVYGAALAASSGPEAAAEVTGRVLARAGSLGDSALAVRAVRLGVRLAPARMFAAMEPDDREAVALARLAGLTGDRVAAELGIAVPEARRRMLRGLRAVAGTQPAPAPCG